VWRLALAVVASTGCSRIVGIRDSTRTVDGQVVEDAPYVAAVRADSPIGYFRLDETAGVGAIDFSGGASGTYLGNVALGQPGAFPDAGTSVGFDGSDSAVSLANRFDFTGMTAFSLEAWIQPSFQGTFHEIGSRWQQPPDRAGFTWWQDGAGFGFERDASAMQAQLVAYDGAFVENQWAYVVATYDGTTMAIYVNGKQEATTTSAIATPEVSLTTLIGAANGDAGNATFLGNIDEYAIYDHALTPERVSAHYAAATNM
jgi:hypothetical protein